MPPIKVVYEAEVKMTKLTDILEAVRTEYLDVDQAEAEIKALMDEEELKDILFGQLVSHERYDDVFARLKISMEDARKLAKAIKQWWESQGKEEGDEDK